MILSLRIKKPLMVIAILFTASCSPLKSSPKEEKHQLELTLHNLQTHLDDQQRDLNCFQTELQILDGRIKYYENALTTLKQREIESHQSKIEKLKEQITALEHRLSHFEHLHKSDSSDVQNLLGHANETSSALTQFKERLIELEQEMQNQNKRFAELSKMKKHFETIAKQLRQTNGKQHTVKPGDSLEKLARFYKVSVESIKRVNGLNQDLIVVGQELQIPHS